MGEVIKARAGQSSQDENRDKTLISPPTAHDVICMPLCLKHDCPRPCPICDKEMFQNE